ncbi:MAG TPA: SDR family oxidoreductase [Gordonia sp. (in: high G+C Gram-positive bacteria)]|uniref:SDR family oxidoreductase n=1 Tax=unclassified Gordonia (in: high G+C Gram-positive bacteria) TaxID=2657482 RepID=UPI000FBA9827|nr:MULTISPECIES: SDR family oxidoreductase [unclassified Gordonia (in: high G+C Gram-positive bacteria)]RUP38392.1 MAG: SDR family oxidoreductase [Gordonia sp. (in: high G+C Gram-positive bacteria)]HNP58273.1 SDR family oxidoreductase [Gordonia sp. (in: high G+C Gram-positive bacteria)]HRC52522.1 SDR family oxidoreductase [Gordonia sp. (in: high G+C Gram-positive bacteria)]
MRKRAISGLVIAVTGGGAGIGAAIAAQTAARGARVAIGDLDKAAADATAAAIGGRGYRLDVTDEDSFTKFLADVQSDLGRIDVLVNNAGIMWVGPFDEEPPKASEAMVAVNLLGVIRGVRLAAPGMRARGQGQIVTIASAASKLSPPGESTYAATKHGVLGYLTGVREELRGSGVTLSVIMPGVVETKLAEGTATGAAKLLQPDDVALAVVDIIEQPRFTLTIPGYVGPLVALVGLAPQRVRDQILRRMVPDQVAATRKR